MSAIFVYTAVDSNTEIVYFYDVDDNVINSVDADGTNLRQFVTNGNFVTILLHQIYSGRLSSQRSVPK